MTIKIGKNLAAGVALTLCALGMVPAAANATTTEPYVYDLETGYTNDPVASAQVERILEVLPADWRETSTAAASILETDSEIDSAIAAALNPNDYECASTPLNDYVSQLVNEIGFAEIFVLSLFGFLDYPTYDALIFGSPDDPNYALREEAKDLTKVYSQAGKFFDTKTDDIQLLAMRGEMLLDPERVNRMTAYFYPGAGSEEIVVLGEVLAEVLAMSPALADGTNPIFTLNAFAFTGVGDPDPLAATLPDKMVMGDGIIAAMREIGYGDVGAEAILGHEMAHHVQYERDAFGTTSGPEATRRTELMADAISTYFVTHKRGVTLQPLRVQEAIFTFASVGDCNFDSNGHHGTPNQRLAAAQWGANLAATTWPKGHIIGTQDLINRFDAVLPSLVLPDAG